MKKFVRQLFLLGILYFFNPLDLSAQYFAENFWHKGELYFQEDEGGDSLKGDLKYNLAENIVQLEVNSTLKTFTARKVLYFKIYDSKLDKERQFYSIPFNLSSDYKTPTFFELLKEGSPYTLFCREKLITQTTIANNPYYGTQGMPIVQNRIKFDYYLLSVYGSGEIRVRFFDDKKTLLLLLQDRENDIKEFMKENKTRFEVADNILDLISYYNSLKK